jgi:hypothetical protein
MQSCPVDPNVARLRRSKCDGLMVAEQEGAVAVAFYLSSCQGGMHEIKPDPESRTMPSRPGRRVHSCNMTPEHAVRRARKPPTCTLASPPCRRGVRKRRRLPAAGGRNDQAGVVRLLQLALAGELKSPATKPPSTAGGAGRREFPVVDRAPVSPVGPFGRGQGNEGCIQERRFPVPVYL